MIGRRTLLSGAALGAVGFGLESSTSAAGAAVMNGQLPPNARVPAMRFVYECDATLSEAEPFGPTFEGVRRIIPITGGTVRGPNLNGVVLPGSYDWNLSRSDGGHSVEAAYFLRTDDGVTIRVVNRGVGGAPSESNESGERFFMFTHPVFEAPTGKYDWLNRAMFIATLGARKDTKDAVLIRVFMVI